MAFLRHGIGTLLFNRPGEARGKDAHLAALEQSRQTLLAKYGNCPQTPRNHRIFTHVIGIERWAQTRLRTLLGSPLRAQEEYIGYRPPQNTPWYELLTMFEQTRADTLTIARAIPSDLYARRIPHNTWGQLNVGGWLTYIVGHARNETRLVR